MSRESKYARRIASTAMLAGAVAAASPARATLIYDFRFADGGHLKPALVGNYSVELWVQVSGTDGNNHNDALTNTYADVASSQVGGPVMAAGMSPNGTVAGSPLISPWDGNGDFRVCKNGGPTSITADGLGDWGSTSTNITNTNYLFARTGGTGVEQGFATDIGQPGSNPAYGINAADVWEMRIAAWILDVTSVDNNATGETRWGSFKIPATKNGVGPANQTTYQTDGVEGSATPTALDTQPAGSAFFARGHYISFFPIPEPGGLGVAALAAGLLGRRRRNF